MWKKINHGGEPTKNIDKKYAIFVGRYQPYHFGHIELIKQKLYALIDRTAVNNSSKEKWLLFLPENEFHEIGLLFAKYIPLVVVAGSDKFTDSFLEINLVM